MCVWIALFDDAALAASCYCCYCFGVFAPFDFCVKQKQQLNELLLLLCVCYFEYRNQFIMQKKKNVNELNEGRIIIK